MQQKRYLLYVEVKIQSYGTRYSIAVHKVENTGGNNMFKKTLHRNVATVIFAVLIVITIIPVNMVAFSSVQDEQYILEAYIDAIFGEGFMRNQQKALEVHDQIVNSLPRNRSGEITYPDFFAGFYLDTDGNLVMLITEPTSRNTIAHEQTSIYSPISRDAMVYELISTYSSFVSYRIVEFSYTELHEVLDLYLDNLEERLGLNCIYARNVVGAGIDREANRLRVRIENYNTKMMEGFKQYLLNSPMVVFEQSKRHLPLIPEDTFASYCYEVAEETYVGIMPLSARINPGDRVSTRFITLTQRGTMGYRVRRESDNAVGFITSCHIFNPDGPGTGMRVYPHSAGASHVGTVESRRNDSRIDASFVITRETPGNTLPLHGSQLGTAVPTSFVQNQVVAMFGASTGGVSMGNVLDPHYNATLGGRLRNGMVLTNINAQVGDSGGVVTTSTFATAGIVGWGISGGRDMIFVPAHRINRDLGVRRY